MLAPLRWLALATTVMAAACLDGTPACANDDDCPSAWQCLRGTCTLRPPSGEGDAGAPDAGAPDAGAPDAGAPDAGASDAGMTDAGMTDAGIPVDIDIEGVPVDGGRAPDAGLLDDGRG